MMPSAATDNREASLSIALVILHADPKRGGAERYTLDVAADLANRGNRVAIIARTHADVGKNVATVPVSVSGRTKAGQYLSFLDYVDQHLDRMQYDVVHSMLPIRKCDVYHPHAGLAVAMMDSGHKKHTSALARYVAWACNQTNPRRQAYAMIEKGLLTSPTAPDVLCLSKGMFNSVKRRFPMLEGKLHVLYNGVNLRNFDPASQGSARLALRASLDVSAEQPVALIVAQDFARKGLAQAIQAMARLPQGSLTLVVVGRDNSAPYQRLAKSLGVDPCVRYVGAVTDVNRYYAMADFLLLPTKADPCSLVVLEALAMGLPVISTRQNGACEIMESGRHGYVLDDPENIAAIANAINEMLAPERRLMMGAACTALRKDIVFENHLGRLIHIYESRVEMKGPRPKPPTSLAPV